MNDMMRKRMRQVAVAILSMVAESAGAQWNNDSTEYDSFDRYRVGGYGEIVASFKNYGINRFYGGSNGNTDIKRNTISLPRFVIAGDYKFSKHWMLGVEVEFESGGTGSEYEIENTENGEYEVETEKGGEVALEQFHITYHLNNNFNVRVGHLIVPVGLNNEHHEPINFFGTVRPEGETSIIPNTWHDTGIEIRGQFGRKWASFDYEAMVVAGLNANGFDRNHWAGQAKQGLFEEDNFTSPAYVGRFNYRGIPGLRLGASYYYCHNVGSNGDKPQTYNFDLPVNIWSVDAQYQNRWVIARGNILQGHIDNSTRLSAKNGRLSNLSPYNRTSPIAEKVVSYGIEAGIRLNGFVKHEKMPDLIPFVRYEYYNPQEVVKTDTYSSTMADQRLKTSMWMTGLNYRPLPYLVIKADYTKRRIGDGKYNGENEFGLGVAFTGWFLSDRVVKDYRAHKELRNQQLTLESMNRRLAEMQREIDTLKKKENK